MTFASSEDSDQPGHPPVWSVFSGRSIGSWGPNDSSCWQRRLIRLGGCPRWSESSLGTKVILLVLSWGGSYCVEALSLGVHLCGKDPFHVLAHMQLTLFESWLYVAPWWPQTHEVEPEDWMTQCLGDVTWKMLLFLAYQTRFSAVLTNLVLLTNDDSYVKIKHWRSKRVQEKKSIVHGWLMQIEKSVPQDHCLATRHSLVMPKSDSWMDFSIRTSNPWKVLIVTTRQYQIHVWLKLNFQVLLN